ncbi:MAG: autotransporter-associated beta strand repeat-containing protein, partial [Verrucomicrobiae bacterium]|nr:autotransporter-associated beta strand repeat-containing protein [Verrucomicrobiae bacterium]
LLTSTNTYTGNTFVEGGVLNTLNPATLPGYNVAGKVLVKSNAVLSVRLGGVGEWTLPDIDTLFSNAVFYPGSMIGADTTSGNFVLEEGVDLPNDIGIAKLGANTFFITNASTYTGPTMFRGGTLSINALDNLGTGRLIFMGGALRYAAASGAETSAHIITNVTGAAIDIVNSAAALTLAGSISGTGSLIKAGAGTLVLSAPNLSQGRSASLAES